MSSPSNAGDRSGGVNIPGAVGSVGGDIVGRDKITITHGLNVVELVAVLEQKGLLRAAGEAGLERQTIITLAKRLKPAEALNFDQAVKELGYAVEVALEVIARGER